MAFIPDGFVMKLTKDYLLVVGEVSRKAQLKDTKNGKQLCKFGVCAGAQPDDEEEKRYVDCVAYTSGTNTGLVGYCSYLDKGDPVMVIGTLQSREYEGKTYHTLKVVWVNSPVVSIDSAPPFEVPPANADDGLVDRAKWTEQDESEDDLPF